MGIITLICLFGADPSLVLTVNQAEIMRFDHLVVKSVIANRSQVGIYIEREQPGPAIQFERKVGDSWVAIRGMVRRRPQGGPLGLAPLLDPNVTYAEYNSILLDPQDRFIFNESGAFQLRAVVQVSGQRLESRPVEITVKPRAPSMIRRIREAKKSVAILGGCWFDGILPDELAALEDAGGNVGDGVKNFKLMSRILSGEEKTGDDAIAYIRKRMNPLDAEVGIAILGRHYFHKRDYANLTKVVEALPDNSWIVWSWTASLEFEKLKTIPMVIVPNKDEIP